MYANLAITKVHAEMEIMMKSFAGNQRIPSVQKLKLVHVIVKSNQIMSLGHIFVKIIVLMKKDVMFMNSFVIGQVKDRLDQEYINYIKFNKFIYFIRNKLLLTKKLHHIFLIKII